MEAIRLIDRKQTMPVLSKSKYLAGLQCHKLLWVHYNRKEWIPDPDPSTQARFDQGHMVGDLAKTLFPGGTEVPYDPDFGRMVTASRGALARRQPIFEAGFRNRNTYARADILLPAENRQWDLVEVKSSTDVKDIQLMDVAFQKHVCEGAGVPLRCCGLMHIDRTYVRRGEVEPEKLFRLVDVSENIEPIVKGVEHQVKEMLSVISRPDCPDVPVGPHCTDPYPCPLRNRCWSFLPERSVFTLYYGGQKAMQLMQGGILALKDIPVGFPLSDRQAIQLECERTGRPHVDREAIRDFLEALSYPLHFLDFETFGTPIPVFGQLRPYQQIPFQYSLKIERDPGGTLKDFSYLADGKSDPRPEILSRLEEEVGDTGSILAYNAPFEIGRLKECVEYFPRFKEWFGMIQPRFVDLLAPFRSFSFYHPDQAGSASLKAVLPVLTGKGYENLEITDGEIASIRFLEMVYGKTSEEEAKEIAVALKAYCSMDTEGMNQIIKTLQTYCT